jgi:hypothetical protein
VPVLSRRKNGKAEQKGKEFKREFEEDLRKGTLPTNKARWSVEQVRHRDIPARIGVLDIGLQQ